MIGHVSPSNLTQRPAGGRMNTGTALPLDCGVGGRPMPEDTVPLPPVASPKRSLAPWSNTAKHGNVFSTFRHFADPPVAPPVPPSEGHFRTGTAGASMHHPVHYIPALPASPRKPLVFSLKTGTGSGGSADKLITAPPPLAGGKWSNPIKHSRETTTTAVLSPRKDVLLTPRTQFRDGNTALHGTFSPAAPYIPTPYHDASQITPRRPYMFTYTAQSKLSPPVQVPWSSTRNESAYMARA